MEYIYHGDKLAKLLSPYAGQPCKAVRRPDGKCIRGRNGNMLVEFEGGVKVVVPGRMLRKIKPQQPTMIEQTIAPTIDTIEAPPPVDPLIELIRETGNAANLCRVAGIDYAYYRKQVSRGAIAGPCRPPLALAVLEYCHSVLETAKLTDDFESVAGDLQEVTVNLYRAIERLQPPC